MSLRTIRAVWKAMRNVCRGRQRAIASTATPLFVLLFSSCGDSPQPVGPAERIASRPQTNLDEVRCPPGRRLLCDRVEAGESPERVFRETNAAKAIPKLSACVTDCPGPYPKISSTVLPAARALEEKLERGRQASIWKSPPVDLVIQIPRFFYLSSYRIIATVEGRALPERSGLYLEGTTKYTIPSEARAIQICFDATPDLGSVVSTPWWSCGYFSLDATHAITIPVSEVTPHPLGSIHSWRCLMKHDANSPSYQLHIPMAGSNSGESNPLEIPRSSIYLLPGDYVLACEVGVRRLDPVTYRTAFSVPNDSVQLEIRIEERNSSNNPADIRVEHK